MKRLARPGARFTVTRARLATFLTEPADIADFFCFVLMHARRATIVPGHRRCKPPAYGGETPPSGNDEGLALLSGVLGDGPPVLASPRIVSSRGGEMVNAADLKSAAAKAACGFEPRPRH